MARRLSTRQQQCKKINREKATKKVIRTAWRRCMIVASVSIAAYVLVAGYWFFYSGSFDKVVENTTNTFYGATARLGFNVSNIYLDGRKETPMEDISRTLGLKIGDSIFATPVAELKTRLESVDKIEYAEVERQLPNTLHIRIIERRPVALWQNDGKLQLVDGNGVIMTGLNIDNYRHLPVVVGEDAPTHTPALMSFLASEPNLFRSFKAAIRVGERRWNIRLANGVEIKLPERNPEIAWAKLAQMERDEQVLEREITSIDLRLPDKVFIRLSPEATKTKPNTTNAQET